MALHFRTHYEMMEKQKEGITFSEPSRTKQDFKDECDINSIMRRYEATGIISHVSELQPIYADISEYGDLQEAFAIMEKAEAGFNALPSRLREELGNDPRNLVGYINNPANREKCIEYGIFNKPAEVVKSNVVPGSGTTAQSSS